MKGEYVEEENDNNNNNNNPHNNPPHNMFAKFSQHPHQQQPPLKFQPPPPHPLQHHFPPSHLHHTTTHPFSEEADSATPPPPSHHQYPTKKPKTTPPSQTTSNEDLGGTIEVSRRPRGRPPGSKNKPKPPVIITREPEPAMAPYILELPSGADIVDTLTRFTRRRSIGLCVLTASGAVANVTLKQPSTTTPGGTVTFHGRFDILSLSAVVLVNPTPFNGGFGGGGSGGGGFTISLAGPQGQIVGGKVVGSLICSGTVYVIAASFNNPTYCRLPLDDEQQDNSNQQHHHHHHHHNQSHDNNDSNNDNDQGNSPVSGGGGGEGSGAISLYRGHHMGTTSASGGGGGSGSEVIWANATPSGARPPY